MNATAKVAIDASMPSSAQVISLAVSHAENAIVRLDKICSKDKEWAGHDCLVDLAMGGALELVRRIKSMNAQCFAEIENAWAQLDGVVQLAYEAFSRKESLYGSVLRGLQVTCSEMPIYIEFAEVASKRASVEVA